MGCVDGAADPNGLSGALTDFKPVTLTDLSDVPLSRSVGARQHAAVEEGDAHHEQRQDVVGEPDPSILEGVGLWR